MTPSLSHPRLLTLTGIGVAILATGSALFVIGGSVELKGLGRRLVILGAIVGLFGVSGYLAFAVFERRDR